MKALRWILFCLLAFGLGTGAAFAINPPTVGIPTATARGLANDLTKIEEYARDGRCNSVRGRLSGAQAKIRDLPVSTADATVTKLQASLEQVRSAALATCSRATEAGTPTPTPTPEVETTPETTPTATPTETPVPETTPDLGGDEESDTEETPPVDPGAEDNGNGNSGNGNNGNGNGNGNGGITIPNGAAIRQRIDEERKAQERRFKEFRKALKQ